MSKRRSSFASRKLAVPLAGAWVAFFAAGPAHAAAYRLSDGAPFSAVEVSYSKPALTADGRRVVYCQDAENDGAFDLWSAPVVGGPPVRISAALAPGRLACWFRLSPDSSRVVYVANQESTTTYELFSTPVDGSSAPVKLNPPLLTNRNVTTSFEIAPDGATVIYRADQELDDRFEIFSVPIGGGATSKVNGTPATGGDVTTFEITPDGSRVVYLADQLVDERYWLFAAPIGGGGSWAAIGTATVDPGDVVEFQVLPGGSRVAYRADRLADDVFELFTVSIDGGASTRLNEPLVTNGDVFAFDLAPDGAHAVYLADGVVDGVFELFSAGTDTMVYSSLDLANPVPPTGTSGLMSLDFPVPGSGPIGDLNFEVRINHTCDADLEITLRHPGGTSVLVADDNGGCGNDFGTGANSCAGMPTTFDDEATTPIGSGTPPFAGAFVPLNPLSAFDGLPRNGTWTLLINDDAGVDSGTLFCFRLLVAGSGIATAPAKLNGTLAGGGDVDVGFAISPDGSRVVYVADEGVDGHYELYSVPIGGGTRVRLNPVLPGFSNVNFDPLITPDGTRVVYRIAHGAGLGSVELDSVPIGGGASVTLSPAPASGISIAQRPVFAAGGTHVFYELQSFPDAPASSSTSLLRVPVAGGASLPVGPTFSPSPGQGFLWIASGPGGQVLFVGAGPSGESELYAGDTCVFCDGFESAGTTRWSAAVP